VDNKVGTLDRPRLDPVAIEGKLAEIGCSWARVVVRDTVTSTNDEVVDLWRAGTDQVVVLAANEQVAGRGRLERAWSSPAGTCVAMSVTIPLEVVSDSNVEVSAVPLYVGLCVQRALEQVGFLAGIKWPNDIVVFEADGTMLKLGGILVQLQDGVLVIGIGLNVSLTPSELPIPTATSLNLLGFFVTREELIARIIAELSGISYGVSHAWITEYRKQCVTIGQHVKVTQVAGSTLEGIASDVDAYGQLIVESHAEQISVSIGDVEHVRPAN
jgi:BirA family transcriptional regulator, biotin operon repressor / biotin---[acetyl-CoA-carboxylase] ligase